MSYELAFQSPSLVVEPSMLTGADEAVPIADTPDAIGEVTPFTDDELSKLKLVATFMTQIGLSPSRVDVGPHHSHFPVAEDEVLLETNNPETRELHCRVVKRDTVTDNANVIPTTFNLGDLPENMAAATAIRGCVQICYDDGKRHTPYHVKTKE